MEKKDMKIKWGWLKLMYWYTIIGAGGFGAAMIILPETVRSFFGWPAQDPIVYGVTASVWTAFGILSIFGLISPLKFLPPPAQTPDSARGTDSALWPVPHLPGC